MVWFSEENTNSCFKLRVDYAGRDEDLQYLQTIANYFYI